MSYRRRGDGGVVGHCCSLVDVVRCWKFSEHENGVAANRLDLQFAIMIGVVVVVTRVTGGTVMVELLGVVEV